MDIHHRDKLETSTIVYEIRESIRKALGMAIIDYIVDKKTYNDLNIKVFKSKKPEYGDFYTNIAFEIKYNQYRTKYDTAIEITKFIKSSFFKKIEIVKPGFINFFLIDSKRNEIINDILQQKNKFGASKWLNNKTINFEFRPTRSNGYISINDAKNATISNSLANIFAFNGAKVIEESFIDDDNENLKQYVYKVFKCYTWQLSENNDDKKTEYTNDIIDIANFIRLKHGNAFVCENIDDQNYITSKHYIDFFNIVNEFLIERMKTDLLAINVIHNIYFRKSFISNELITKTLNILKKYTFINDTKIYLQTNEWGDNKSRVIVNNHGQIMPLLYDVAYNLVKASRGYDMMYVVWDKKYIATGYSIIKTIENFLSYENFLWQINPCRLIFTDAKKQNYSAYSIIPISVLTNKINGNICRWLFLTNSFKKDINYEFNNINKYNQQTNKFEFICYVYKYLFTFNKNYRARERISYKTLSSTVQKNIINQLNLFKIIIRNTVINHKTNIICNYLYKLCKLFNSYWKNTIMVQLTQYGKNSLTKEEIGFCIAVYQIIVNCLTLIGINLNALNPQNIKIN